jgi:hypothetical protein
MERYSLNVISVLTLGLMFFCMGPAQAGNFGFRTDNFGSQFNAMAGQISTPVRAGASKCYDLSDHDTTCSFIVSKNLIVMSIGAGDAAPAQTVSIVGEYSVDGVAENVALAWIIMVALVSPDLRDANELLGSLFHEARGRGGAVKTVGKVDYYVSYTNRLITLGANAK